MKKVEKMKGKELLAKLPYILKRKTSWWRARGRK